MSSSDEEDFPSANGKRGPQKKKRLQRSCDLCRKRKIRCDSATMPQNRCSSCISFNTACLHTHQAMKRGPKNRRIEELQKQVAALEAQLQVQSDATSSGSSALPPTSEVTPPVDSSPSPPALPDEDLAIDELAGRFKQFSFGAMKHRFFGSSSGFRLISDALTVKEEVLGRPIVTQFRRPEYWHMRPWEKGPHEDRPQYIFPDQDLIASLMELYWECIHPTMPLLHRPTFERCVAEGLHLEDYRFGALLLAVLALGSRYSDDPRVFIPGPNSSLSAGWSFFTQVQVIRKSLFDEPSIYEVQLYCLISMYTLGTSTPHASWLYIGLGIRFVQERGEHRRKPEGHKPTVADELWKRAFWCLLSMDRTVCSFLGRPSAVHVEDYDLDLPLEVDDEYWEHPDPDQMFKQPPGKPSLITYFNCHIRLSELLGSTLRRMYASNKARVLLGLVNTEGEQRAVADLDSAMNEFISSIPSHLRWDPNRTGVFFDQSAVLHTLYYALQITIHRPYILRPTMLALPSLTICTSAARSLINVVDVWLNRLQRVALAQMHTSIFIAAIVLLLNLFGAKRAGLPIDVAKELAHVSTALRMLKFQESRWQTAGRLWELLQELNSWDGPPPSKYKKKTMKGDVIHETEEAGRSVFTDNNTPTPSATSPAPDFPAGATPSGSNGHGQNIDMGMGMYTSSTLADELSPAPASYRPPAPPTPSPPPALAPARAPAQHQHPGHVGYGWNDIMLASNPAPEHE
ncbi:Zn(2)-C6 fungal-type domain-containing protein [Mycena sanguinolenta]|uniref:Zn(2)-C6 fungal-type domain-containing protein n=1 Tax=Mycena sanguinolenta TaxID=230812 RepID=A0A8H6ZEF0_9AGAR|nr:Zn(2)-C6 fungal-type domain-containing protein [Mycena sanguinolenta]